MQNRNVERIKKYICNYDICTGCGICESYFGRGIVCLELNPNGHFRPLFQKQAVLSDDQYESFIKICPALNMRPSKNDRAEIFGNIEQAWIGWSNDDKLRYRASSGGGVTSFLLYLLDNHLVDGIIHVTRNEDAVHCSASISRTKEDIVRNCGSLYMPSKVLTEILQITNENEKYAFVGKGCDIKAIKRYNNLMNNRVNILYYIGIMCGGTPSYQGLRNILNKENIEFESVNQLKFRGDGWPGLFRATTIDNKLIELSYNEAWAKYLGPTSGVACKICFDGIAEQADITFGDAWYCKDTNYPSFEEADGRNLILVRTRRGLDAVKDAIEKRYISIEDRTVNNDDISLMQPSQFSRRYLAKYKMIGVRLLGYKYPIISWKQLNEFCKRKKISIVQKNRTVMGMIKRARKGKISN